MDLGLEAVAEKMRFSAQEMTRILGDVAAELSSVSHVANHDATGLESEIARLTGLLDREKTARETAERNKERFRYALWVYLQERDSGVTAPTPETLKLIRELIKELE